MAIFEWKNGESGGTPLNATNLNAMQQFLLDNQAELGDIANGSGSVKLGKLGVEWGTISVTSSEEGTSAQGTTLYQANTTLNFKNIYVKNPRVLTNWGGAYTNQIYTFANYITATNCNIGGYVSSSNSTRTIAYLVIGQV